MKMLSTDTVLFTTSEVPHCTKFTRLQTLCNDDMRLSAVSERLRYGKQSVLCSSFLPPILSQRCYTQSKALALGTDTRMIRA